MFSEELEVITDCFEDDNITIEFSQSHLFPPGSIHFISLGILTIKVRYDQNFLILKYNQNEIVIKYKIIWKGNWFFKKIKGLEIVEFFPNRNSPSSKWRLTEGHSDILIFANEREYIDISSSPKISRGKEKGDEEEDVQLRISRK